MFKTKNQRPFRINGGYKTAIIINGLLCLLGIAVIIVTGIYCTNNDVDEGTFTSAIICGVALTLIGVASAMTGLFHYDISKPDNKGSGSTILGVIASLILLIIGVGLLVFSCTTRNTYEIVAEGFGWFIACGCIFTFIGLISFGVSGWFVARRKRMGENADNNNNTDNIDNDKHINIEM